MRAPGVLGLLALPFCAEVPLLLVVSYLGNEEIYPVRLFAILAAGASLPVAAAAVLPMRAYFRKQSVEFDHTPYTILAIAGAASCLAAANGGHGSEAALLLGYVVQWASVVWAVIAGCNLTGRSKADA